MATTVIKRKVEVELPPLAEPAGGWGPAMSKLTEMRQRFVLALIEQADKGQKPNYTDAARDAGFSQKSDVGLRVQAHQLANDKAIQAALEEVINSRVRMAMPLAVSVLQGVMENPQHKDHAKAAMTILDRGGIGVVQKVEHSVKADLLSDDQVLAQIKVLAGALAEAFGVTPERAAEILGGRPLAETITDADYEEVPADLAELW